MTIGDSWDVELECAYKKLVVVWEILRLIPSEYVLIPMNLR
jgi:hypothetical protein